jgi:hypothetical protein
MGHPEHFQDYLFHYNPYTEMWAAFKREHSNEYFNGQVENVVFYFSIKDLVRYIDRLENSTIPQKNTKQ